jgi:hypothetical protein
MEEEGDEMKHPIYEILLLLKRIEKLLKEGKK